MDESNFLLVIGAITILYIAGWVVVARWNEADRAAGTTSGERGAERGLHSGRAALDLEACLLEHVAEVARALVLLVRELRMFVDETVCRKRGVAVRFDSREDVRVVHEPSIVV